VSMYGVLWLRYGGLGMGSLCHLGLCVEHQAAKLRPRLVSNRISAETKITPGFVYEPHLNSRPLSPLSPSNLQQPRQAPISLDLPPLYDSALPVPF
jgi:hypothetical protein